MIPSLRTLLGAAAVLAAGAGGCRGCRSSAGDVPPPLDAPTGASQTAAASPLAVALPLFADDRADPYNELHALLFGGAPPARYAGCANGDGGDCLADVVHGPGVDPTPRGFTDLPGYADRILITVRLEDAEALAARIEKIASAVRRLEAIDPRSRPSAALLLQHDIWAVFDALFRAGAEATAEPPLLDELARAMHALALPASEIERRRPTLGDVLASDADVFGGRREDELVELVGEESEPPSAPPRVGTTHARVRASRSVFRRYIHVPGGDGAAHALLAGSPSSFHLPQGSLALIVETPLAVSSEGQLVASPLVMLAETRRIVSVSEEPRLAELGFDVFEGRRAGLRAPNPHLDHLAPGAPFPSTGSCGDTSEFFVPRRSCVLCHGIHGDDVRGFAHGATHFRAAVSSESVDVVLREKAARADFRALTRRFGRL